MAEYKNYDLIWDTKAPEHYYVSRSSFRRVKRLELQRRRQRLFGNQQEFAKHVGLSVATVRRIENSKRLSSRVKGNPIDTYYGALGMDEVDFHRSLLARAVRPRTSDHRIKKYGFQCATYGARVYYYGLEQGATDVPVMMVTEGSVWARDHQEARDFIDDYVGHRTGPHLWETFMAAMPDDCELEDLDIDLRNDIYWNMPTGEGCLPGDVPANERSQVTCRVLEPENDLEKAKAKAKAILEAEPLEAEPAQ